MRNALILLLSVVFLLGPAGAGAQVGPPDLILANGKVLTVDGRFSVATAIAIRGERIAAVGTNEDVRRLAGPATRVIDLGGKTVIPGLIDNHVHMIRGATYWPQEARLDGVASRKGALEVIAAKARSLKPGEWVLALGGWSEDQFADEKEGFTREELDRAAPRNPVFLQIMTFRAYANSLALKAAKIDERTPDPKGSKIGRGKDGKPSGRLDGEAWRRVRRAVPAPTPEQREAGARAIMAEFNRVGVTAVLDVGGGGIQPAHYKPFEALRKEGKLTVRTFYTHFQEKPKALLKRLGEGPPPRTDLYYQLLGIGETFFRPLHDTAYRAFKAEPHHAQEVRQLTEAAVRNRWHVHMHATHDATTSFFLDIFEAAGKEDPVQPLRWVFAHADAIGAKSLARMRSLGMMVAVHSRPLIQGLMYRRTHKEASYNMPPMRLIQQSGIRWGLGTDTFVVAPYNPFLTLWWATTGKMVGGEVVHRQTVSREDALRAHTASNAWFLFQERNLGSLERGKLADLVVLGRDYMSVPLDEIKDLRSVLTMVGGKVVHREGI